MIPVMDCCHLCNDTEKEVGSKRCSTLWQRCSVVDETDTNQQMHMCDKYETLHIYKATKVMKCVYIYSICVKLNLRILLSLPVTKLAKICWHERIFIYHVCHELSVPK